MMPPRNDEVSSSVGHTSTFSITDREDFSLLSRSLQRLIKPLRPRLVAPPRTPFPPGSPIITPIPESLSRRCHVEERNVRHVWTYALSPKVAEGGTWPAKHNIYYFCGGGFQNLPSSDHWKLLAELSRRLGSQGDGTQLHVVSYPLAPRSPAADSLRILRLWLEHILAEAIKEGSTVALAGDSSGGNLALTLALAVTGSWSGSFQNWTNAAPGAGLEYSAAAWSEDADVEAPLTMGRSPHVAALTHILLLCPAVDMRNSNPEMDKISRLDPILTSEFTGTVAKIWCGAMDSTAHPAAVRALSVRKAPERAAQLENTDPRVSPVLANLHKLADCGVQVDGLVAGHDVLSADALVLAEKLRQAGVSGQWQNWKRMMHCWPLTWWARVPEALEGLDWMVQRLLANQTQTKMHAE